MKKFCSVVFCLLLTTTICFAQRKAGLTGRYIPSDNHTLVFCGQNNTDSEEFVKINNKVPAGFMIYTSLQNLEALDEDVEYGTGKMSGNFILKNYKKAALQIGLFLVGSLDSVIDGSLDDNIKKLGEWITKANVPVFLRIGYEFDLPENNYDPDLYKQAFKYIVDKLDEQKVKNVAYVWHSRTVYTPKGIDIYYPGDEYVDWCAISYFANPQWFPMVQFAKAHNKPLMIAECSPTLGTDATEADKIKWYRILFKFIQSKDIKALCYINGNWDEQPMFEQYAWGNGKLDISENIKNFWLENIKDSRFINLDKLYKEIKK
ncbi:MAG: hypothetical protein IKN42_08375 [Elusimicrobia bacterium]|nr:hypothetical protein [Elusimicrobiota bacterium]